MATPQYSYLIADTRTNTILAEVMLDGVSFNKPLNAAGSFNATWTLGPATSTMDPYDLTTPCRRCIYAVRDDRPIWGGLIWTRAYNSATRQVQIGAAEFWTYFDHRKVLPRLPGRLDLYTVAGQVVRYERVDQNEIVRSLVRDAQAHVGGDLGIEFDDSLSYHLRDRTYQGYDLTDVGEALRNLANIQDGPDIVFDVAPSLDGTAAPRRVLRVGTPYLGQRGSSHVWELGGNVIRYEWPTDGSSMASRTFATGEGVDHGTPIAVYEDEARYEMGFPLLEYEANYSGAEREDTLNAHAYADYQARRMPVALPRIEVRGDIPPTAAGIDRGDDGWLVLPPDEFLRSGFEGPVRVTDMQFSPSASAERVALTLAPLLDEVA